MIMLMKTILWDYNGTILDDVKLCHRIECGMLKKRGMRTFSLDEYKDMFCFPVIDYYYKMGYTFETESYEDISVEFNEAYDAGFGECRIADGFHDVMQRAQARGIDNVIISAANRGKLLEQCVQLGISSCFSEILGTDNLLGGSKIHLAEEFMKRSGLKPEDCMFIGDTLHDMETAAAVGIRDIVLVASGHQSRMVLEEGWDNVVDTLKEIKL